MEKVLYTVGHSNHPWEHFLELLREYEVDQVIDVRSVAASRYNPQYNQRRLAAALADQQIQYVHMPVEFGARQTDARFLDENGKVDFEKVRASASFRQGIIRLGEAVAAGRVVALMCSEAEPFDCHRFAMITPALCAAGFEVRHILKDKTLKSTADLERLLLKKYAAKLPWPDIFAEPLSPQAQLTAAYRLRNQDIAWSPK